MTLSDLALRLGCRLEGDGSIDVTRVAGLDDARLDTLFLAAYSRLPRADERDRFLKVIRAKPDPAYQNQAYANIFWALLNSPEFVLCP